MSLQKLRICAEKTIPSDKKKLNQLKNTQTSFKYKKLKAAFYSQKIWPENSVITIAFLSEPKNIERTKYDYNADIDPLENIDNNMPITLAIKKIVQERIQPIVNLKFVFVDNPNDALIRIDFKPEEGAWSYVGTDCKLEKNATMNFGWYDVATVMHEFGHALGMIHEHQSPFGEAIQWNVPKVLQWARETQGWDEETTRRNIIEKYDKTILNGSLFDPDSIMLYFYPEELTLNKKSTKQNLKLSPLDILWIYKMYSNDSNEYTIPQTFYEKIYDKNLFNILESDFIKNIPKNFHVYIIVILIVLLLGIIIFKK